MKAIKQTIAIFAITIISATTAVAQNEVDNILGDPSSIFRADDVPAGESGRYYIPGAAAGKDSIFPSSYTNRLRIDAHFKSNFNYSCGQLNFYNNFQAELRRLQYQLRQVIKNAQRQILASLSGMISGFYQYLLSKINPTLGQLSLKQLDEFIKIFDAQVKSCQEYERDVLNGKNPLSDIVQIAVGDQWKTSIGLVNQGSKALEEAAEELVEEARKNGVSMADGKKYGGDNQEPINITKSLLTAGMNLVMGRDNKDAWENSFVTTPNNIYENPILKEFKKPSELYEFIEEIYGANEKRISTNTPTGESVKTIAGRGYEKTYAKYRNELIKQLRDYVNRVTTRTAFETTTGIIIPPAEVNDIRQLPPYEQAMEIESRARDYAIGRIKKNLLFAKQALKTGIYAPDMQQSGMSGPSMEEYKSLYYRIMDDLTEISQRAYQY